MATRMTDEQIELALQALRRGHLAVEGNPRSGAEYKAEGDRFVVTQYEELSPLEPLALSEAQMREQVAARPEVFGPLTRLPAWEAVGDALVAGELSLARAALPAAAAAGDPYDHVRFLAAALRPADEPLAPEERDALRARLRFYDDYHALMTTLAYERSARVVPAALAYYTALEARLGPSAYLAYHRGDFLALGGDRAGARAAYEAARAALPPDDPYLPPSLERAIAALDAPDPPA